MWLDQRTMFKFSISTYSEPHTLKFTEIRVVPEHICGFYKKTCKKKPVKWHLQSSRETRKNSRCRHNKYLKYTIESGRNQQQTRSYCKNLPHSLMHGHLKWANFPRWAIIFSELRIHTENEWDLNIRKLSAISTFWDMGFKKNSGSGNIASDQ